MSAQVALVSQKGVHAVVHLVGIIWTGDDALPAGNASISEIAKLGFGVLPFRIVAPEAAHGTAFEEHGGADARTIVQGEALDVKNNVSSVHYDTVREGLTANEMAAIARADIAGRSALFRPAPR